MGAETRVKGVRPSLALITSAEQNDTGIHFFHLFIAESQLLYRSGGEIFDHDIGPFDKLLSEINPFFCLQVYRHTVFVIIADAERPGTVQSVFIVFVRGIVNPESVRPLIRLDMHHSSAMVCHMFPNCRSSRNGSKFYDFNPLKYLTGCFHNNLRIAVQSVKKYPSLQFFR